MGRYGLKLHDLERQNHDDAVEDDLQSVLDSSEDEVEMPHPLPFSPKWGLTRFGLHPPRESFAELQKRIYGPYIRPAECELKHVAIKEQKFPPLSTFYDSRTASAVALVEYGSGNSRNYNDDGMDMISRLLHSQTFVDHEPKKYQSQVEASRKLRQLADGAAREQVKLDQWKESYQRNREKQHKEGFCTLRSILKADHEAAKNIIRTEQKGREDEEKLEESRRQEKEELDAARREAQQKLELEEQKKRDQQLKDQENVEREEAEKMKYILDAQKLMERLVYLREEIQPFDVNKFVAKRRMNMKKMCRGRVNTLASDVEKVRQVAFEVVSSIKSEIEQDEIVRNLIQQGNTEVSADMAKGKLYYMDLLASSAIVRIQAEGFNGPRGDGFPLAAFLAMVSSEIPEFNPIFEAHVYNVCPTVIPHIPKIEESATEDELMESLGMIRDKTGNFESFDRFLTRTEGIISIVANIVSSLPDHHTLFGGCSKAILWLHRFLSLLPPSPIQLPLNTAPVLESFLTGAGHMLANLYADEFKPILYQITTDIAPRLDEGSIGAPSAHRLKETIKNGFEGFLHTLPTRALKDFYNNGILTAPSLSHDQVTENPNPFSASNAQSFMTDSFNNVEQGMASGQTPPFGIPKSNQTDFTTAQSITSAYPNQGSTNSPFGALNTSLPTSFGVSNTTTSNPFGAPSTLSSTPFGASNSASSTPFGVPRNTQSTPFGTSITGSSTFGVPSTVLPFGNSNTSSSTPFGNPSHGISSTSSSPFGVASAGIHSSTTFDATKSIAAFGASSASPFGNSSNSAQSGFASGTGTSFGDIPKNSANAKGFEGNQTYQQFNTQPFGGINGNVASGKHPIPCKFFAQGSCRNGNNCRFSHDIQPNNEMESTSRSGQTVNNGLGNNTPFGGPRR